MSRRQVQAGFLGSAFLAAAPALVGAATDGQIRLGVRDSIEKLVLPILPTGDAAPKLALHAARNETVTFQVVLRAAHGPLGNVRVSPRGRGVEDGSLRVELFLVHHALIETPSDAHGARGRWPDALVPLVGPIEVGPDAAAVVWVQISARDGARPGRYEASLTVEAAGAATREAAWTLDLYDVALPLGPTLPFMVGIDWDSLASFEGLPAGLDRLPDPALSGYFKALRTAGAAPFNPFARLKPSLAAGGAGLDLGPVERRLREALGPRLEGPAAVPFALDAPIDAARYPPFSDGWRKQAIAYLRQVAAGYARMGVLDRAFIYVAEADEPTRRDQIGPIAELHRLVREADPRLRVAQTIHARCFDCEQDALAALESPVTLWVPNIAFYDGRAVGVERSVLGSGAIREFPSGWPGELDARIRRSGRPIWWYFNAATSALPKGRQPRYPSLNIDDSGMSHRMIAWLAWDQGIDAVGHWMATYWRGRAGPWEAVPRGDRDQGPNGDGVLLYPSAGASAATGQPTPPGPCSSIRLEMIREGGADHKLLSLATAKIGRDAVRGLIAPMLLRLDAFETDIRRLRAARLALLKELSR